MVDAFRGMRFELVSFLAREPRLRFLYQFLVRRAQHKARQAGKDAREAAVGPDTELVIDGFQGSANTFLTAAFKHSQSRPVVLAHHLHAPSQIIRAVERGIPTIVTIRDPRSAALSLTSRWPYVSIPQALRSYIGFYRRIQPYRHGYVLSTFDHTIAHVDAVIRAVNQRFGTDFDVFIPTQENIEAVRPLGPEKLARKLERQRVKQQKARAFESEKVEALLARAEACYEAFTKEAELSP